MSGYEIIEFKNDNIELSVNVSPKEDTVWLTKEQMAILFGRDRSVISRHIHNIYKENELDKISTCAKNAHIVDNRERLYETELYNLDVIISVGNPCVIKKYRFDNEMIKLLDELKWWDKSMDEIKKLIPLLSNSDSDYVKEELKKCTNN